MDNKKTIIELDNCFLELIDDCTYTPFSADNPIQFEKIYISEDIRERGFRVVSKIGIFIRDKYDNDLTLSSAIICETGGATGIGNQTYIIKGDSLILCICNMVYSLGLITLDLNWKTKADHITCFTIHEFADGLITHGEFQLTQLDFNGVVQWEFSARDIFVTYDNTKEFRIENDLAIVKDWSGYEYFLNTKGEIVKESKISK